MNGYMMRTMVTINTSSCGLYARAAAPDLENIVRTSTIHGATRIPNNETALMNTAVSVIILLASAQAD